MHGSYSSYSSSYTMSMPMDIQPSCLPSRSQDAGCAFPAWPRRSSLSSESSHYEERATSFLSDEDLELYPFDDDSSSISSSNNTSPAQSPQQRLLASDAELLELERQQQQQLAYQRREVMRFLLNEKVRRQAQAARRQQRRPSTSSSSGALAKKSSPKSNKLATMTPIAEACE